MTTSTDTEETTMNITTLAAALVAFQAEMPVVAKSKTANVPMKGGGSYRYTYADLADLTEVAMPALTRHGLAFITTPRQVERGYELVGRLVHSSGETIEGSLALTGGNPQEIGSAITYARRYLLGAMTGIVTDDDDDGSIAKAGQERQQQESREGDQAREELRQWASSTGHDLQTIADTFATEHGHSLRGATAQQVVTFQHALLTAHQQAVTEEES